MRLECYVYGFNSATECFPCSPQHSTKKAKDPHNFIRIMCYFERWTRTYQACSLNTFGYLQPLRINLVIGQTGTNTIMR